ncbi:hypothetical protein HK405_006109 [Cladochytrium tenue]|nr:hypothetical protein HK405_006109 [Cladochytrium tenue]
MLWVVFIDAATSALVARHPLVDDPADAIVQTTDWLFGQLERAIPDHRILTLAVAGIKVAPASNELLDKLLTLSSAIASPNGSYRAQPTWIARVIPKIEVVNIVLVGEPRRTIEVQIDRSWSIRRLQDAINDKAQIPPDNQLLTLAGKHLKGYNTLASWNIFHGSVVHVDLIVKNPIISKQGFGTFDLETDAHKTTCPLCQNFVLPHECGFYSCTFRFAGLKRDESTGRSISFKSQWQKASPADNYICFQESQNGAAKWIRLIIETKKELDTTASETCPCCLESLRCTGTSVVESACCSNRFHASCIGKWSELVSQVCPMCQGPLVNRQSLGV